MNLKYTSYKKKLTCHTGNTTQVEACKDFIRVYLRGNNVTRGQLERACKNGGFTKSTTRSAMQQLVSSGELWSLSGGELETAGQPATVKDWFR